MITPSKLPTPQIPVLFKEGKSLHGNLVYFKCAPLPSAPFRWQVIVPASVTKSAVKRNHLKRQLREAVRAVSPLLSGFDCLVVAKPALLKGSFAELVEEMGKLLRNFPKS